MKTPKPKLGKVQITDDDSIKLTVIRIYKGKKLMATINLQDGVIVVKPEYKDVQAEVQTSSMPMFNTTYTIKDFKVKSLAENCPMCTGGNPTCSHIWV